MPPNEVNLTNVFTPAQWVTGTNTTISTNLTFPNYAVQPSWSEPTMTKAKQDPLDWLSAQVGRYVELGTLHD